VSKLIQGMAVLYINPHVPDQTWDLGPGKILKVNEEDKTADVVFLFCAQLIRVKLKHLKKVILTPSTKLQVCRAFGYTTLSAEATSFLSSAKKIDN